MELTCYETSPERVALRPAPRWRSWMEGTPAYHCLPLVIANLHGWEMVCPFGFEVVWNGGNSVGDLQLRCDAAEPKELVVSNFGFGILSLNPSVVMRTPPGINLWVTGPVNSFKDGIQAMSASIETDWMPSVFSINWKITRVDHPIRFEQGEPFCAFFPIKRGLVSSLQPRVASIAEAPELLAQVQWATARRNLDGLLGEKEKDVYQKWYHSGEFPQRSAGSAPDDHEVTIALHPFQR